MVLGRMDWKKNKTGESREKGKLEVRRISKGGQLNNGLGYLHPDQCH